MLAKGKVTRYAQAETRREEISLLYTPCLSRASVGLGEWFARNHQWDRGITTSLQAILTHKSLPKQLHQQTHKLLLWNSLPVNSAVLGEINQSDTNYIQKLQVMTSW